MQTKDILKELRKSKGYNNAKDFCESSGISYNTYQNYETGKRLPTAEFLMQIADFYGVTTDYLLGREPAQPDPNPFENIKLTKEQEEEANKNYKMLTPKDKAIVASIIQAFVVAHKKDQPEQPKESTMVAVETAGDFRKRKEAEAQRKETA